MDQPVIFGAHDHLMGIVTQPGDRVKAIEGVAAIMLTPGMIHSCGPFRMHVDLARHLSANGLRSLRFDLSGIGESLGVGAVGSSIDRAAAETAEAMDMLGRDFGCERFVLFGLCSGADDSVHTALGDERVAGVVVIDGCGFRTSRFYFHRMVKHYLPRLARPAKWMSLLQRKLRSGDDVPSTLQAGTDVREFPGRDEAARQLQTLTDRRVNAHFVYTGGVGEYYNHPEQFYEMFHDVNWQGNVSTRFFPMMDHVALLCEDRRQLIAHIGDTITEFATVAAKGKRESNAGNNNVLPLPVTTTTDPMTSSHTT